MPARNFRHEIISTKSCNCRGPAVLCLDDILVVISYFQCSQLHELEYTITIWTPKMKLLPHWTWHTVASFCISVNLARTICISDTVLQSRVVYVLDIFLYCRKNGKSELQEIFVVIWITGTIASDMVSDAWPTETINWEIE